MVMGENVKHSRRRWFQFGLGTLFVGIVILSVILSLLVRELGIVRQHSIAKDWALHNYGMLLFSEHPWWHWRSWTGDWKIQEVSFGKPVQHQDGLKRFRHAFPTTVIQEPTDW
jgi:hypothetical protein